MTYEIWIDASCKHKKISKNKYDKVGESTVAFVVKLNGAIIDYFSSSVGVMDNNQAEYLALIHAINYAVSNKINSVVFYTDSSLVEKQMNNKYSCNSKMLHPYYSNAKKTIKLIEKHSIVWIKRNKNKEADMLCNMEFEKNIGGSVMENEKID
jgi:ribonuclease HI